MTSFIDQLNSASDKRIIGILKKDFGVVIERVLRIQYFKNLEDGLRDKEDLHDKFVSLGMIYQEMAIHKHDISEAFSKESTKYKTNLLAVLPKHKNVINNSEENEKAIVKPETTSSKTEKHEAQPLTIKRTGNVIKHNKKTRRSSMPKQTLSKVEKQKRRHSTPSLKGLRFSFIANSSAKTPKPSSPFSTSDTCDTDTMTPKTPGTGSTGS